ncbi:MAG: Uma2 family endonuclease [Synechococcaceae cyanobacterium SM2_3_1]|nr:Uma2 family endonuclease [Synechococcaceae cyanobacterium SM2_3_1]
MQLLDPKASTQSSSFVLDNVTWDQYEALLNLFGDDQPGLRMNYLNGTLELWMPGREHERLKKTLTRLIEAFAEEYDLELNGYGSTTFRKQAKERGLEPDECYCLGELKDFPDIAVEIALTTRVVDRFEIYRGLEVREVWVWRNKALVFYSLESPDQPYQVIPRSNILPQLDPELLLPHLEETNQTRAVKVYRSRLRQNVV